MFGVPTQTGWVLRIVPIINGSRIFPLTRRPVTSVRLISVAVMLGLIMSVRRHSEHSRRRSLDLRSADWRSVFSLFAYMALFSFAYLSLSAGTGALILFGAVQLTMFGFALRLGEHFTSLSWTGLILAILGLVFLVSPGVTGQTLLERS